MTGNCYFQTGLCYRADNSDIIIIVSDKKHGVIIFLALEAQLVKNLPAMQETPVQFLGQKDPLEKGMATHSSRIAWRIPWTEKSGRIPWTGLQSQT